MGKQVGVVTTARQLLAAAAGHYTVYRRSASTGNNREYSLQINRRLGIRGNGAKRSARDGGDGDGDSCGPSTSSCCLGVAMDVSCSSVIVDKWTHNVAESDKSMSVFEAGRTSRTASLVQGRCATVPAWFSALWPSRSL